LKFRSGFVDDSDFNQFIEAAKLQNYSLVPELLQQTRLRLVPVEPVVGESNPPDVKPDSLPTPDETPKLENEEEKLRRLIEDAKDAAVAIEKTNAQTNTIVQRQSPLNSELQQELMKRQLLDTELQDALKARDKARSGAERLKTEARLRIEDAKRLTNDAERRKEAAEQLEDEEDDAKASMELPPLTSSTRHARYPVSATQLRDVFGVEELTEIAATTSEHIENHANGQPDYHNVRAFLGEEFDKAWKLLVQAERTTHYRPWDTECKGLANDIRLGKDLTSRRMQYRHDLTGHTQLTGIFEALGWAILVDSALLDQQLHDDMKRVAAETGGLEFTKSNSFDGLHFWGTHDNYPEGWNSQELPTPMAAFRDYVACRWPIHVFAIDPVTQDQNVADSFSSRREIQLTLSVALASGQINAQEYLQYARRLETELDTIALNRTVVGFSHGTDTFGWRFQPRIQTPPTPSNARVFFNEMLIGGPSRDAGMRTSMLEAGTRECVAVVLMPSILNQVDVDFRSSWYRLDKPHSRKFDLEDSVSLGQEVVELQALCQQCFKDKSKYRKGDIWRLEKAVNQLEKQLPLQNSIVHVPTENTLGGTQLFEGGQTSLGPELIGFYGEPGVHKAKDGDEPDDSTTTLFLVGRNFSVTGTKVIAAGQGLAPGDVQVISREVLQVTIPAVREDKIENNEIDLHVATAYGVSHHLKVPVAGAEDAAEAAAAKKAADDAKKAAEEAAETAVTNHVGTAHAGDPSTITWKVGADVETDGKIVFDSGSNKVKSFDFDNSAKTELKLTAPKSDDEVTVFTPGGAVNLAKIEVAFWVKAFKKEDDKDAEEIGRKAAGLVTADLITDYGSIRRIVDAAVKGITQLNTSSDVKYLEVEAFVRTVGSKAVYPVPGKLHIDVETGTDQVAVAAPVVVPPPAVPTAPVPGKPVPAPPAS
jgi:hypothetical protein